MFQKVTLWSILIFLTHPLPYLYIISLINHTQLNFCQMHRCGGVNQIIAVQLLHAMAMSMLHQAVKIAFLMLLSMLALSGMYTPPYLVMYMFIYLQHDNSHKVWPLMLRATSSSFTPVVCTMTRNAVLTSLTMVCCLWAMIMMAWTTGLSRIGI